MASGTEFSSAERNFFTLMKTKLYQ